MNARAVAPSPSVRIMLLRAAKWLFALPLLVLSWSDYGGGALSALSALVLGLSLHAWEQSSRRRLIREARLPRFVVAKLRGAYPHLDEVDAGRVLSGLRQFFMAHLRSRRRFVAMPSKVVDAAWHELILHTAWYARWCRVAFGGMLHHTPAEVLGPDAKRNDGLRRAWYWACKEEGIDPRAPDRLPLLFALDAELAIEGGYRYVPDCGGIDRGIDVETLCAASFGDADAGPGDARGFGGSEASGGDGGAGYACGGSDGGCGGGDAGASCGGGSD